MREIAIYLCTHTCTCIFSSQKISLFPKEVPVVQWLALSSSDLMVPSSNPSLGPIIFYHFSYQNDYFRAVQKVEWYSEFILESQIYNIGLILPCSHSFFFSDSFFDLGIPFSFRLTNSSIPFDLSCPCHTQSF